MDSVYGIVYQVILGIVMRRKDDESVTLRV